MFSKVALFVVASMAVFVAALPADSEGGIQNSCNSGPVQCCNSMQHSSTKVADSLKSIFQIPLGAGTGDVGVTCTPIQVLGGISGHSCSSQPVCCSNNTFKGVVAFGCSPLNINI